MSANAVVVYGVVQPDGSLQLEGKVPLPAGKVQITVEPIPELPEGDAFFELLKGIWAARARAGLVPRSVEEVEALRRQLRDETELEINEAGRLQDESRQSRQVGKAPAGGHE